MSNIDRRNREAGHLPKDPPQGRRSSDDLPSPGEGEAAAEDIDETSAGGLHYPEDDQPEGPSL
jgi:hypothetical protein